MMLRRTIALIRLRIVYRIPDVTSPKKCS